MPLVKFIAFFVMTAFIIVLVFLSSQFINFQSPSVVEKTVKTHSQTVIIFIKQITFFITYFLQKGLTRSLFVYFQFRSGTAFPSGRSRHVVNRDDTTMTHGRIWSNFFSDLLTSFLADDSNSECVCVCVCVCVWSLAPYCVPLYMYEHPHLCTHTLRV